MDVLRSLFDRFRAASTPGRAAARGVPADRIASAEAELAPLLVLLEPVERTCADLRAGADRAGEAHLAAARAQAEAVVAAARRRAEAERSAAAAAVVEQADLDDAEVLRVARAQADAITARTAERMPRLVALAHETMARRIGALP